MLFISFLLLLLIYLLFFTISCVYLRVCSDSTQPSTRAANPVDNLSNLFGFHYNLFGPGVGKIETNRSVERVVRVSFCLPTKGASLNLLNSYLQVMTFLKDANPTIAVLRLLPDLTFIKSYPQILMKIGTSSAKIMCI